MWAPLVLYGSSVRGTVLSAVPNGTRHQTLIGIISLTPSYLPRVTADAFLITLPDGPYLDKFTRKAASVLPLASGE